MLPRGKDITNTCYKRVHVSIPARDNGSKHQFHPKTLHYTSETSTQPTFSTYSLSASLASGNVPQAETRHVPLYGLSATVMTTHREHATKRVLLGALTNDGMSKSSCITAHIKFSPFLQHGRSMSYNAMSKLSVRPHGRYIVSVASTPYQSLLTTDMPLASCPYECLA